MSYQHALNDLESAQDMIHKVLTIADPDKQAMVKEHGFLVDKAVLNRAQPFSWSKEVTQAVMAASRSIPMDTRFNSWNLDTPAAWWHFDEPLPWQTIDLSLEDEWIGKSITLQGIRSLAFGWMDVSKNPRTYPAGSSIDEIFARLKNVFLGVSCWVDNVDRPELGLVTPSQTFLMHMGESLEEIINRSRKEHKQLYGPGGRWHDKPQVGEEKFIAATEGVSRFILAGLSWVNQRVVTLFPQHIERHQRKRFNLKRPEPLTDVKVVVLRRAHPEPIEPGSGNKEWTKRWLVDGHWRNQACGDGMKDRRLTWINPYVKGPEDMPLVIPKHKIYRVSR